jgi:hypothetical protein
MAPELHLERSHIDAPRRRVFARPAAHAVPVHHRDPRQPAGQRGTYPPPPSWRRTPWWSTARRWACRCPPSSTSCSAACSPPIAACGRLTAAWSPRTSRRWSHGSTPTTAPCCRPTSASSWGSSACSSTRGPAPPRDAIGEVLGKFGATQRSLDLFGLVISLESRVSEGDHTLRTALCALEVRRVCPTASIALVLGQIPPPDPAEPPIGGRAPARGRRGRHVLPPSPRPHPVSSAPSSSTRAPPTSSTCASTWSAATPCAACFALAASSPRDACCSAARARGWAAAARSTACC